MRTLSKRIKLVFAVVAAMAALMTGALPAFAEEDLCAEKSLGAGISDRTVTDVTSGATPQKEGGEFSSTATQDPDIFGKDRVRYGATGCSQL